MTPSIHAVLFLVQILMAAFSVLGVFHLRKHFGLTLFFILLGAFQYLQGVLSSAVYAEVLPGWVISPGSVAIFPSTLFGVLLMHVCGSMRDTRQLIYGLVLGNISLSVLGWIASIHFVFKGSVNPFDLPVEFFRVNPRLMVVGTIVLYVDTLFVVLLYEMLARIFRMKPGFVLITLTLVGTLCLDAVLFMTGSFLGTKLYPGIMFSNMAGKALSGLVYGCILTLYLRYGHRSEPVTSRDNVPFRSLFNSLTLLQRIQELKKTEEHYQYAVQGANDGLWDWDIKHGLIFLSSQFFTMIGATGPSRTVEPGLWFERIHPEDRAGFEEKTRNLMRSGAEKLNAEFRIVWPGGRVRWMYCRGQSVKDDAGRVERIAGSLSDITERRQAEQAKDEFIAIVSHELRTPVTNIRGSLGLLDTAKVAMPEDKRAELLDIAVRNCDRLEFLVNDILDIQKLESGRMEFNMAPQDLNDLVRNAVDGARGLSLKTLVTFSFVPSPKRLPVNVDVQRMGQVMLNLLSNASKFSPEGSVVEVVCVHRGTAARVEISDEGPGVDPQFEPRIFEKFAQQDKSPGRTIKGTGLGLSICRSIVERHGGRIGYAPRATRGSTFWFELQLY